MPHIFFLCSLFAIVKAPITVFMYHNEKSCIDLITCMSSVIKNLYTKFKVLLSMPSWLMTLRI